MIEMQEKEYTIGEVASILHEEIHNLRYWQKELELPDRRNEMNQRVYTQTDINNFRFIKELRENENLSLRAIKKIIHKTDIVREETAVTSDVVPLKNSNYVMVVNKLKEDLLGEIGRVIKSSNQELREEIEDLKDKIDYMEEERSRKLDVLIEEWRKRNQKKGILQRIFK